MNRTVIILSRNHFDNTWRRCWDRAYEHRGRAYASYVTVERAVLDEMLRIAGGDGAYSFEVESSRLLRRYVEDHPPAAETLRRLCQQGRFALLGSGEVIPDANMPRGETLVRNLAEGLWWSEEAFGRRPTVGWHADGFGSCAQLPQIFAGCGMRWIAALSYKTPSRDYWRGLDGTVAYIGKLPNQPVVDYVKYPPCPACGGAGCAACGGYGLGFIRRLKAETWVDDLIKPLATLTFFGEEVLPPADLPRAVAEHESPVEYRFGTHEDLLGHLAAAVAACDDPPAGDVSPEPDGNPTTSGGLVSRIELKRRHRFAEAAVTAAEAWVALTGESTSAVPADLPRAQKTAERRIGPWERRDRPAGPAVPALRDLWRDLAFGAFHDALPATHIDPSCRELMDLYDHLEDACAAHLRCPGGAGMHLFNATAKCGGVREVWPLVPLPAGELALRIGGVEVPVIERTRRAEGTERLWADLPEILPGGSAEVEVVPSPPAETEAITGEPLRWAGRNVSFEADGRGLVELRCDGRPFLRRGEWHPGELIVEKDIGDPWATRDTDRPRRAIGRAGRRTSARRTAEIVELVYAGSDPAAEPKYSAADPLVLHLDWTQRWRFYADRPYVDLRTEIDWSSYHRRVRLAFPTGWDADEMWTEVPFGVLARPRYEMDATVWNNANGDWPALGWGAVEHGGLGLAVLNRGTPSYRCEAGTLLVSVLRSPAFPNCLEEPRSYSAPDYDGMRDAGRHVFEHRIVPYAGTWQDAGLVELAEAFGAPVPLADGPGTDSALEGLPAGVTVSALKPARSGTGLVIRLVEMSGREQRFSLRPPGGPFSSACRTNLLEDVHADLAVRDGRVEIEIRPWEILTVLLRK